MPAPSQDTIVTEDRHIPGGDNGIELFLRNKRPASRSHFGAERTLLIVHGGTQAAEVTFDLELDHLSWAGYIAAHGWDVWLVNVRGFGSSTRPAELDLPIETAPPVVRTADARRDFAAAADFILRHRGIDRINVLAWSWGTIISGGWAAEQPDKAGRLALFGPAWNLRATPSGTATGYVRWSVAEAFARLQHGAPEHARGALTPAPWYQAWAEATLATDPQANRFDPPRVRSPNGVSWDIADSIRSGNPLYEAQNITAPTLLVTGEWDGLTSRNSVLALFDSLTKAREKRYVELGEATHFAHLERRRLALFATVQAFLETESQ